MGQGAVSSTHPRAVREAIFARAQERFGGFIRDRINSGTARRDRDSVPFSRELQREAIAIGLANYCAPAGFATDTATPDGAGSARDWGLLLEWLGYACDDLALPILLGYRHTLSTMLYDLGCGKGVSGAGPQPHVIDRFVKPILSGERFMSVAYTEGADPFSFRSSARKVDGGYAVDGYKSMITGGLTADWILAFVGNEKRDLMVVVIDAAHPGVKIEARDLMGMRSMGVARMDLDDVFIPDDHVLIRSDGLTYAQQFFNGRRLHAPCAAVGRIQHLFERCVADLSERIRYRLPVSEMQSVQARMGQMYVAIETARTVVYDALARYASGGCDPVWDTSITVSKYFAVEQATRVAQSLVYVLGGAAYDRAEPYERGLRDLQALIHIAGTQATLETDLGIKAIAAAQQRSMKSRP